MKIKFYFFAASLLCLLCLSLSSCGEEEVESTTISSSTTTSSSYYLSYNTTNNLVYSEFIANGDTLEYEITLNEEKSDPNAYITKVEYYWDGNLIQTNTGSAPNLCWVVKNQSLGEHELKIIIHADGDEFEDSTTQLSLSVTVVDAIPFVDFVLDFPREISNGEIFTCAIYNSEDTNVDVSANVTYYWDDQLIMSTTVPPYELSYPLSNQSVGIHKLTIEMEISGVLNFSRKYSMSIEITE